MRFSGSFSSGAVLLFLLLPVHGLADEATLRDDEPRGDGSDQAQRRTGVLLIIQASQARLEASAVSRELEAELGVPVHQEQAAATSGTIWVTATGEDEVLVVYQGNGRRYERSVRLPIELDRRLETVALVAGNLARDETGQLIARLLPSVPADPTEEVAAADESELVPRTTPTRELPTSAIGRPEATSTESEASALTRRPLNLSLFHPIALYPDSERLEVNAELGFAYSYVGRVRGAAFSVFVSRLRYGFRGLQFSGLVNLSSEASSGVSVAGVFAQQLGEFQGALIAGAATHASGVTRGLSLAGAASWHRGAVRGLQLAGAINFAHDMTGVQLAGSINWASRVEGVQWSGLANLAHASEGIVVSGGANVATEQASGAQVAVVNLAQRLQGLQLGIVNVAEQVEGAQIGVVNVAESVKGASVGVLPIAKDGRQHLVLWTAPGNALANTGFKFRVGPLYSLLCIGYSPGHDDVEAKFLPGAALGGHVAMGPAYVEIDALYQSQHTVRAGRQQRHLVSLRPQLGFSVHRRVAFWGGLAAEADPEDDSWSQAVALRGLAGVQLF